MKTIARIAIALVVLLAGASGLAAATPDNDVANNNMDQDHIDDRDLADVNVNAGNPTLATAVSAGNVGGGPGSGSALADADSYQNAGDDFDTGQDIDQ